MVKNAHYLVSLIGIYGLLAIFNCVVVFCLVYSYLLMPETHGLSLQEVQSLYKPVPIDRKVSVIADTCKRRKSSVRKLSIRSNSLVLMDPCYGLESEKDIQKRLDVVHKERAANLQDEDTSRRRASTLSINY